MEALPERLARHLGQPRPHRVRLQSYMQQLEQLGLAQRAAKHEGDEAEDAAEDAAVWTLCERAALPVAGAADGAPPREVVLDVRTEEDATAYWAQLRALALGEAAMPGGPLAVPRDLGAVLTAADAWQDTLQLRPAQRTFLRRYVPAAPDDTFPAPALVEELAQACFAPPETVRTFLEQAASRTGARRGGAAPTAVLSQKVEERRAQREAEYAAVLAEEQAQHPVDEERREKVERLLQQHRRRYMAGKGAQSLGELHDRVRSALTARARRPTGGRGAARSAPGDAPTRTPPARAGIVRRRARNPVSWTRERQELLRDVFVILRARNARWQEAQGRGEPADWSAVMQLIRADPALAANASAAWNTWRSRLKQLAQAPAEQVSLALLERAWTACSDAARAAGELPDEHFPDPREVDLGAQVAFLRAHVDKQALAAEHEAASRRTVLPRVLDAAYAARWRPLLPPAPADAAPGGVPGDTMPVVHRLHALRDRPFSLAAFGTAGGGAAPGAARGTALTAGVYDAAIRMLVASPKAALDAAQMRAWAEQMGAAQVDAAIARLLERRVVRFLPSAERAAFPGAQLVFGEEHQKASSEPLAFGTMLDACRAARACYEELAAGGTAVAHPAATDGETAAWILLLDKGAVHAEVDLAPLQELRKRTQLNARTLDDVETECKVVLRGRGALAGAGLDRGIGRAPSAAVPGGAVAGKAAAAAAAAGADGVPATALPPPAARDAQAAVANGAAFWAGYDVRRLVASRYADAWSVPVVGSEMRVFPRTWLDVHGAVSYTHLRAHET